MTAGTTGATPVVTTGVGGADDQEDAARSTGGRASGGRSGGTTTAAGGDTTAAAGAVTENAGAIRGAGARGSAGSTTGEVNVAGAAGDAGHHEHGEGGSESGHATAGEGGRGQAGDAADAGAGAGAVTVSPDAFGARLALWLAADAPFVTNDAGVQWHDLSGSALVAAQTDPEFAPALSSNALAGYPGGVFDGVDDYVSIPDTAALELGTRPFVLEIVFSHTTDPSDPDASGGGVVFSKQLLDDPYEGIGIFVNRPIEFPQPTTRLSVQLDVDTTLFTPPNVAYDDGRPRLLGMRRTTPDDYALRLNGKEIVYGVDFGQTSVSAPAAPLVLGGNVWPGQALRGVISEIVLVRDVTDEEVGELEGYLLAKYGGVLAP
jgi:hypothetical protein